MRGTEKGKEQYKGKKPTQKGGMLAVSGGETNKKEACVVDCHALKVPR